MLDSKHVIVQFINILIYFFSPLLHFFFNPGEGRERRDFGFIGQKIQWNKAEQEVFVTF